MKFIWHAHIEHIEFVKYKLIEINYSSLTQFWAGSDESFPFMSVTLELPSLLWWITADDDVVDRTSQPRVLRRYHVRTTHRWNHVYWMITTENS